MLRPVSHRISETAGSSGSIPSPAPFEIFPRLHVQICLVLFDGRSVFHSPGVPYLSYHPPFDGHGATSNFSLLKAQQRGASFYKHPDNGALCTNV